MCDMYGHGFYWKSEEHYTVYMNFEENSHALQYKNHPVLIPVSAIKCGFDPVNGQAVSNDNVTMPQEVKDQIKMAFVANFPDRESIKHWIRNNYGKNNDKEEWNYRLGFMLSKEGLKRAYGAEGCKQQAEGCKQQAEYWKQRAEYCKQQAEGWKQRAKDWKQRAEYCKQQAEGCKQRAKDWKQRAEDCGREISCDSLDWLEHFLQVFEEYPNDYWSDKNIPVEKEYQDSILLKTN